MEDLEAFVSELKKETDRGLPLVGTVLIDEKLGEILKAFFIDGKISTKLLQEPTSPLATFSAKIDICFALGLIDDFEFYEINILRRIRNEFAHKRHGISFETGKIKDLCSNLRVKELDGFSTNDPKLTYMVAVSFIALRIYNRSERIKNEKRISKSFGEINA